MPRALFGVEAPPPFAGETNASTTLPQFDGGGNNDHSTSSSSSVIIVAIVISSAIIASASLYLFLRYLSRRCHRRTFSVVDDVIAYSSREPNSSPAAFAVDTSAAELIESLPVFTFGSVTGNIAGGDCAVCLSKFEKNDRLRLLPLCCHAFHCQCIDTWLTANQTCPLCRSTVHPTEDDVLNKILSQGADINNTENNSRSFRIEIGSISRRRGGGSDSGDRRSYSVGSFDYIVDIDGHEVPVSLTHHRRGVSSDKEVTFAPSAPEMPAEELAAEVGSGRSWLRDYVDRLGAISSRTLSFRSSGRWYTGSSRRSDVAAAAEQTEAYRVGEEIGEFFRWLSGV